MLKTGREMETCSGLFLSVTWIPLPNEKETTASLVADQDAAGCGGICLRCRLFPQTGESHQQVAVAAGSQMKFVKLDRDFFKFLPGSIHKQIEIAGVNSRRRNGFIGGLRRFG